MAGRRTTAINPYTEERNGVEMHFDRGAHAATKQLKIGLVGHLDDQARRQGGPAIRAGALPVAVAATRGQLGHTVPTGDLDANVNVKADRESPRRRPEGWTYGQRHAVARRA